MKYPNPWSCQVEITRNCSRRCSMCGINSTGWKLGEYEFMTTELAEKIAIELNNWLGKLRIEFALQGEPLANPRAAEIIKIFRDKFPKSQLLISTNGDFLTRELAENLFNNGLNILLVNCYDKYTKPRIQEILAPLTCYPEKSTNIPSLDFYKDKPKVYCYQGNNFKEIIYIDSVINNDGISKIRKLNNQGSYGNNYSGKILPLKNSCSNVFREIVIKANGDIMSCCMDWLKKQPVGKFPEKSLKEIWEGEKFNNIRKQLYNYDRTNLELCKGCDYVGFKVGIARKDWSHIFEKLL